VAQRRRLETTAVAGPKGKIKTDLAVSLSASPIRRYADHTRGSGIELYRLACQLDLEGIVAKRADSIYEDNPNVWNWIKIKNPAYSQKEGRADFFKRAG
jgi:ATP-dependent DNA ligase